MIALRDRGFPVEYIVAPTKVTALPGRSTTWRCSAAPKSSSRSIWADVIRKTMTPEVATAAQGNHRRRQDGDLGGETVTVIPHGRLASMRSIPSRCS